MRWDRLAEQRIQEARARGLLDMPEGTGKPLGDGPSDGTGIGFRIMAEAGALPEEVRLAKAIEALRAALGDISDPAEREARLADLAELEMRHAVAREARRKYLG